MRTSVAFFAGVGTVVVAIGAGLGGGLLMADIMNPHPEMQASKLDHRPAPAQKEPAKTTNASNDQPPTAPYLAATQQAANAAVKVAPAPQPPHDASNVAPPPGPQVAAVSDPAAKPAQTASEEAARPGSNEQASAAADASLDVNAKDATAKSRDADVKRMASDRRRADRRQPWADRHRAQQYQQQAYQQQGYQQPPAQRDDEMRDVEQRVREQPLPREVIVQREPREVVVRRYVDRPEYADRDDGPPPPRAGFPLLNLFGGQGN